MDAVGGAERDRTADLLIANEALSQLSYGPRQPQPAKAVRMREWAKSGHLGPGFCQVKDRAGAPALQGAPDMPAPRRARAGGAGKRADVTRPGARCRRLPGIGGADT